MNKTRSKKATVGEETDRERAWSYIREAQTFTIEDLMEEAGIRRANAESLIQDLRQAGVIERVFRLGTNGQSGSVAQYELVTEPDQIPQSVGTRVLAWRQQVWNALRIQRTVTVPGVKSTFYEVDPADDTVYRYLRRLEKAGYVRRAGRSGKKGQVMSHLKWMLVRDTGPDAPGRQQLNREIREQETGEQETHESG